MMQMPDLRPMMPEILMVCLALGVLMLDLFIKRKDIVAFLAYSQPELSHIL